MDLPLLKNAKNLAGKRILVRIDVNVPIVNGKVEDDFRIKRTLPTLEFLKEKVGKVILLSHHSDKNQTLEPVARYIHKFIKTSFVSDMFNERAFEEKNTLFLCENLRFYKEEEENDAAFSKKIAKLGEVYVNEAFSVSHRKHASIVTLPKMLPHYAGFLFEEEVRRLETTFNPPKPFLFILGGRKAETKLALAQKFIDIADYIFIGGAVVNNIFKAQGYEVGKSIVDDGAHDFGQLLKHKNVVFPKDVVIQKENGTVSVKYPQEVLSDEKMLDAGPEALNNLNDLIQKSAFVVWNGPLGQYEIGFEKSTIEMIHAFKKSKAQTLIGGGDTVAAISKFGSEKDFGFLSTGGGAMLEFLANRTLPGIDALRAADTRGLHAD
ncbi:MAG: phosphoglycerate kinase [Parcubacteria group bacterium]|nr:phosphoglycerate kinase [Parcubacteria group bacterium]